MKREMSVCGSPPPVTCGLFPETPVVTLEGILPAGYLSPGDRIVTRSGGAAPLRAVVLGPCTLAPVLLRAGALGAGMPVSDIRLAPDQEVLVRGDIARRFFGTSEALLPARRLPGAERLHETPRLCLLTLHFDRPHVFYAEGVELASGEPIAPRRLPSEAEAAVDAR